METFSDTKWFEAFGWSDNPFKIQPDPEHIVGFIDMRTRILTYIHSRDPFLVIGPTGAGKTTLLKWIEKQKPNSVYINFLDGIDKNNLKKQIDGGFWSKFFGFFTGKKEKIVLMDEIQEMNPEIAKWLRRRFDDMKVYSMVMATINPNLNNLEDAFKDRIGDRIVTVRKLTEEEAFKIVRQRIFSHGKHNPFTDDALKRIFEISGYSPRKILEKCEACCIQAVRDNMEYINRDFVDRMFGMEPPVVSGPERKSNVKKISPVQQKILKILSAGSFTTSDIAKKLGVSRASIAKQLSRLSLKTDKELLKKKGVISPLVKTANDGRPVLYELTEEGKKLL